MRNTVTEGNRILIPNEVMIMKKTGMVLFMIGLAAMLCAGCENRNTVDAAVSGKESIIQDTDTAEVSDP